jgi:hypothetical protein
MDELPVNASCSHLRAKVYQLVLRMNCYRAVPAKGRCTKYSGVRDPTAPPTQRSDWAGKVKYPFAQISPPNHCGSQKQNTKKKKNNQITKLPYLLFALVQRDRRFDI